MISADRNLTDWLRVIRSEYDESPGLSLTKKQAERLWMLDGVACSALLEALVDAGYLKLTRDGRYVRAN
jgi:hypothetical protein